MKKKKIFALLLTLIILLYNSISLCALNQPTNISSPAVILLDSKTTKMLYGKNENQTMYPASLTKIMTAILTIENCRLTDKAIASYNAVSTIPQGYSIADIQIGEEFSIEQLLELLLLHSANDAANILAEYVGGSIESFVSMMNTKANELGMKNTHFTNAYGLHDGNHYSTAYDLAILMKYCMKDDNFRKIAGMTFCSIPITNKFGIRTYNSTNELIIPSSEYHYSYASAGKTGFTSQAKYCLVSTAYKNSLELICVVLGSNDSSTRFTESKQLFEYGFNNFSIQNVLNKGDIATTITVDNGSKNTRALDLIVSDNISALLKNDELNSNLIPEIQLNSYISAPVKEGEVLGEISYKIDDNTYRAKLIASHDVKESQFLEFAFFTGIAILLCIVLVILLSRKKN